ncbi:MAG: Nramp family divalent metal transporter [Bacillota bacterium]
MSEPVVQTGRKIPPKTWLGFLAALGPGLFIAAFHLGPGDVATHAVIGSLHGLEIVWALVVGVVLLGFLTEMVGRYVAVTGNSIFDGFRSIGSWASTFMFIGMLGIWATFGSATSLAAGLGWQAVFPFPGVDFLIGVRIWGTIMLFVCFLLVFFNKYLMLENIIKVLVVFMTLSFLITAVIVGFDWRSIFSGLTPPFMPQGAAWLVVAQIAVVVGGVTSIMYGYASYAKGWTHSGWIKPIRFDITFSYILLFIIDLCIMMAAFKVLMPAGVEPRTGIDLAFMLEPLFGKYALYIFSLGLWGAATTTLFGAFLGSYGFLDFLNPKEYHKGEDEFRKSGYFKSLLVMVLVLCGMFLWVYLGPPIWMMMILYITGAVWMPVMAIVLVILTNSRKVMGDYANAPWMRYVVCPILIALSFISAYTGIKEVFFS